MTSVSAEPILYLSLLIICSKLFEQITHRVRLPSMIGSLGAGILLGPSFLSIVKPIPEISVFITIGVFLLFFLAGFEETDLPALLSIFRRRLFFGSVVGYAVPFVLTYALVMWEVSSLERLLIATIVAMSSLGVVVSVLADLRALKTKIGLEIFAIVAIIEFLGLMFGSVLMNAGNGSDSLSLLFLFLRIGFFFVISWILGRFVLPSAFRFAARHGVREFFFGALMGGILIFAWFSELSGLHGAVGALLFGIALSAVSQELHEGFSRSIRSVAHGFLIPLFFAGIGLYVNLSIASISLLTATIFMVVVLGSKFLGSMLAARISGLEHRLAAGTAISSKGAVDLALLLAAFQLGIIHERSFSLLTLALVVSVVLYPLLSHALLRGPTGIAKKSVEEDLTPNYARLALAEVTAKDAMSTPGAAVPANTTIQEFYRSHFDMGFKTYLVIEGRKLKGIFSIKDLTKVPKSQWRIKTVTDIMTGTVTIAYPDDKLSDVIDKMILHGYQIIPVVSREDPEELAGVVTRRDVLEHCLGA